MASIIDSIEQLTTIGSNSITILIGIPVVLGLFYYFGNKKHKAVNVSSKTFRIPIDEEDIRNAIMPSKIYDEMIELSYNKNEQSPLEFCKSNHSLLKELKNKYSNVCVFGIAEMFIFVWIGYILGDSLSIRGFRKLKNNSTNFYGNPWAWPSFFSLKWFLGIKTFLKNLFNQYYITGLDDISGEQIVLLSNISYRIDKINLPSDLSSLPIVEFSLRETDTGFLINEGQVAEFYKKFKKLSHKIDETLGPKVKVHFFGTLPVPFCVKVGQSLHRDGPEFVFYEKNNETNEYVKVFSTNDFNI